MKKRNEIDFFAAEYRTEDEQTSKTVGIVDGDSAPAFTSDSESNNWNAVINNPNGKSFQLIPIDYNIEIEGDDGQKESTCDAMVLCESERFLAFVELKIVRVGGDADARKQLKNTIQIFNERHDYKASTQKTEEPMSLTGNIRISTSLVRTKRKNSGTNCTSDSYNKRT